MAIGGLCEGRFFSCFLLYFGGNGLILVGGQNKRHLILEEFSFCKEKCYA